MVDMEEPQGLSVALEPKITRDQVVDVLGAIDDAIIVAIIETGATIEELEEAAEWAAGESDVMGEMERKLAGAASAVYDILTAPDQFREENRD